MEGLTRQYFKPLARPASRSGIRLAEMVGMRRQGQEGRRDGFTLIEAVVVVVILGTIAVVGIPRVLESVHRSRFEGFLRQVQALAQQAKLAAVRRSAPVLLWVDAGPAPARVAVSTGEPPLVVPATLAVAGPAGPHDAFDGLTRIDADVARRDGEAREGNVPALVFESDGSVRDAGAIRFADASGNVFELRVTPRATARIAIRKHDPDPQRPRNPEDGGRWYERDEGGWTWN